jgi:hypothetical protein
MPKTISTMLLLGAMTVAVAAAQKPKQATPDGRLELSFTYDATLADAITKQSFWMQGGSVELHGQFYKGWGVVADITGLHTGNMHSSGVPLSLVTATFGARYTWQQPGRRYALFGQLLGGEAFGFDSIFPAAGGALENAKSLAAQAGGGMNIDVSPHLALRAFEADWLRTQMPNTTTNVQNSIKMGAGVIFRFH